MQVEGIPEGWEFVRIGCPYEGEFVVDNLGDPWKCDSTYRARNYVIIRKVEKPKQYRPFRSAEEFRPQRCRWVRHIASDTCSSVIGYSDRSVKFGTNKGYWDYETAFEAWVFDDGSPFGVEVA